MMQFLKNPTLWLALFGLAAFSASAQRTQTLRGRVVDKESKTPLIGAAIRITDANLGSATDTDGYYRVADVPVGKHAVTISYLGYLSQTIPDVLVTSAHEVILPVELEESANEMKEVEVTGKKTAQNEMALVSTKTFDVQEVERYAGSRDDVPRMASNFAGVQGGDDSRNDIIIRGNSPEGVLWRLEDIDIPNPNHFNIPGTTGGPVTMLNNKVLANSDFYTGAFPAEYGNGVAGVFDIHMRNGNPDRYEFTGQFGFLGTELAAEGPISKKDGSSFLIAYRYSTLQLFQTLNINIGTQSVPSYQDINFKFNFPLGKKAELSVFGIGGLSTINLVVSTLKDFTPQLYGESDRDQYFTANGGVAGAALSYHINSTAYTKLVVAETGSGVFAQHNYVYRDPATYHVDSLKDVLGYTYLTYSTNFHWFVNKKFSARQTLQAGVMADIYQLNFIDSSRQYPVSRPDWVYRNNYQGSTSMLQAYAQYKYRPSDNLSLTAGLHAQYLTHNGSKALEPRAAAKWIASPTNVLSFGYGLHSEALPFYQYFSYVPPANTLNPGSSALQNENVDFIRSHHFVLGYDHDFTNTIHLKLETYYQYLFNVPVETVDSSTFSALDQGSDYSRTFPGKMQNTGKGYNYGIEFTLSKSFSSGYYVLFTGSVFDSKATGHTGVYYNTDYNSHYAFNLLGGYEHKLGPNNTLIAGAKITYAGGKLYSPANEALSNAVGDFEVIQSKRNSLEFPDYFRADVKIGIRINSKKVTHEFALDLVNVTNHRNILSYTYSIPTTGDGQFSYQTQLGFLPLFYYRIDFALGK